MKKRLLNVMIVLCILLGCQGCTYRAWYEGLKDMQRIDCQKLSGVRERQECLDRANGLSYDQYTSEVEKREHTDP